MAQLAEDVRELADELASRRERMADDSIIEDTAIHAGHEIAERLYRLVGDLPRIGEQEHGATG